MWEALWGAGIPGVMGAWKCWKAFAIGECWRPQWGTLGLVGIVEGSEGRQGLGNRGNFGQAVVYEKRVMPRRNGWRKVVAFPEVECLLPDHPVIDALFPKVLKPRCTSEWAGG